MDDLELRKKRLLAAWKRFRCECITTAQYERLFDEFIMAETTPTQIDMLDPRLIAAITDLVAARRNLHPDDYLDLLEEVDWLAEGG